MPAKKLILAKQNGREWWLDPDVALGGETYEDQTIAWLRSVIKPGMTAVDIGANVGQISLEMAHLVGPTGRVISVEPSPGNIEFLKAHVSANGFDDRITIVEAACCADDSGELVLEVAGDDPRSIENGPQLKSIGLKQNPKDSGRPRSEVRVRAMSVDSLCGSIGVSPDVLKVDVEGAEVEVFRGAKAMLNRKKPRVIFGFHPFAFQKPNSARLEIKSILADAGLFVEGEDADESWTLREYTVAPWPR